MEPNFGYITISNQLFFAFRVIFKKKSNLSPFYFIVMKFIWFINWTFTQMMWLGGWGGNHLTLSQNSQLFRIWWASDQSINGLFRLDTKFAMHWRPLELLNWCSKMMPNCAENFGENTLLGLKKSILFNLRILLYAKNTYWTDYFLYVCFYWDKNNFYAKNI